MLLRERSGKGKKEIKALEREMKKIRKGAFEIRKPG